MDVTSVDEVLMCADPSAWRQGDSWLAGGTVIYSYGTDITRGAPTRLLDITVAGWAPITWHPNGALEIAATCRIADLRALADDPLPGGTPRGLLPGLELIPPACDSFVASWKIWHVSTVGGNVATALPAGPMISLLAAWGASALILRPDGTSSRMPVADLVAGPAKTLLGDGELIRSFTIAARVLGETSAFRRISLTERGRSAALLIGRRTSDAGVKLAVTASVLRPILIEVAPASIAGPDALVEVIDTAVDAAGGWYDDIHGEPSWRRLMTHRLAAEIVAELLPHAAGFDEARGRVTGDLRMERSTR